jgi:3-deoxy-D-manno-octulosonic-acid transferase
MSTIYSLGILIFTFLVYLVSPFNLKARLWIRGRKGWFAALKEKIRPDGKNIWFHCASLGEFEQGRPVIEAIKKEQPDYKIILTFFSPSGYEIRKDYKLADYVAYLPADIPVNASRFINQVNPVFAVFVKYEFWNNYISALYRNNIPVYLISGVFHRGQHFFKWYGSFFRRMLGRFSHFFVQDQKSFEVLKDAGFTNITLTGDTRFDRVVQIAAAAKSIHLLEKFRGNEKLFLAGSSWKQDEEIIAEYINRYPGRMKWIFAPHEIDKPNIERLERLLKVKCVRFSEFDDNLSDARILIIDNIGMLSSAYRYAYLAAIGGGFGKGIHNILEAACWNIPVLFGPNHDKFREAVTLLELGGAKTFKNIDEFTGILNTWIDDQNAYKLSAEAAGRYVKSNTGATDIIIEALR